MSWTWRSGACARCSSFWTSSAWTFGASMIGACPPLVRAQPLLSLSIRSWHVSFCSEAGEERVAAPTYTVSTSSCLGTRRNRTLCQRRPLWRRQLCLTDASLVMADQGHRVTGGGLETVSCPYGLWLGRTWGKLTAQGHRARGGQPGGEQRGAGGRGCAGRGAAGGQRQTRAVGHRAAIQAPALRARRRHQRAPCLALSYTLPRFFLGCASDTRFFKPARRAEENPFQECP